MFKNDSVIFCYVIALGLGVVFTILGQMLTKKKEDVIEQFIIGAFMYFGLFQCFAFPMILYGAKLSTLSKIWAVLSISIVIGLGRKALAYKSFNKKITIDSKMALALIVALLFFVNIWDKSLYSIGGIGWDTSHYLGSISNAVYTDTMYQYDGAEGTLLDQINLHFAMCGFYMHTAVLCQIFKVHPLLMQRYTMGAIAIVLALAIIYKTIELIVKDKRKTIQAFALAEVLMFYYYTSYTGPYFMLNRIVEAKTWCAMVVYPGLAWALFKLYRDNTKNSWLYVFFIAFASVPISVSSLIGTPVMILSVTIVLLLRDKKWVDGLYGVACMVPNGVYCLLYLISMKGLIVFEVK